MTKEVPVSASKLDSECLSALSVQIPAAPQCVTSAFPTTVDRSVTSAAPASSSHPLAVLTVTAVVTPILKVPSSFVTPKLATACAASTTRRGPSASSARRASSATPRLTTARGQVSGASDLILCFLILFFRRLLSSSAFGGYGEESWTSTHHHVHLMCLRFTRLNILESVWLPNCGVTSRAVAFIGTVTVKTLLLAALRSTT